ncbi:MAG: hypothetical protein GWM93_05885 [Gemmatimonadetes bacterium]|nr:hypothetical protein [Gemmatimonadota bacterium]NIY34788.1 hypothetical protein [Gemmatimonadota bacterium]
MEDGDSDDSLDIDAPDGGLVADTVTGFGTDLNPVETRVRALDLDNTTSGDVHVFESDSLHVTKIDQQADPGDVTVSFSGTLTGQANANAAHGTVSFERRDFTNQVIAGTGKTLGQLSVDNTVNTAVNVETRFSVFDKTPEFDGKTVAQGLNGSVSTPFVVNVFAEEFELFEVGEEARGTYEGLQGFKEFWGALSRENTEVVRRTLRSRDQDEARRKKPAPDRQRSSLSKEDETASRPPSEDGGWAFLKGWLGAFR